MRSSVIVVFASQVLSPDSNINKEKTVRSASQTLLARWRHHLCLKEQVCWTLNRWLQLIQVFLDHITKFVLQIDFITDFYDMATNMLCIEWPKCWYSRFNDLDATAALIHENCFSEDAIKRSRILYYDCNFCCFEKRRNETEKKKATTMWLLSMFI